MEEGSCEILQGTDSTWLAGSCSEGGSLYAAGPSQPLTRGSHGPGCCSHCQNSLEEAERRDGTDKASF